MEEEGGLSVVLRCGAGGGGEGNRYVQDPWEGIYRSIVCCRPLTTSSVTWTLCYSTTALRRSEGLPPSSEIKHIV